MGGYLLIVQIRVKNVGSLKAVLISTVSSLEGSDGSANLLNSSLMVLQSLERSLGVLAPFVSHRAAPSPFGSFLS